MGRILVWVAVALIVLWLVGFVGFGDALGSFVHLLLIVAAALLLVRILRGR